MRRCQQLAVIVAAAATVAVAASSGPAAAASAPEVWVSILPQKFIVERIAGEHATCRVIIGPGQSPHTYEPSPQQVARLQHAALLIRIGAPFERGLLSRLAAVLPGLDVVDGRAGIPLVRGDGRPVDGDDGDRDGEGNAHAHPPGEADPHFWLDPTLMQQHARTVGVALSRTFPAARQEIEARTAELVRELDALDRRIAAILAPYRGRELFAYHPAYGYFARRYGLELVTVEAEGKEPGPRELAQLIERARAAGVRSVFVQSQFSDRSARALAEAVGASVVALDPLPEHYVETLEETARAIAAGLTPNATGEAP